MKKLLLIISIIFLYTLSIQCQVYKYIPDSSFRYELRVSNALPFNSSGDSLDISSLLVINRVSLRMNVTNISSISGIEYFINLDSLTCRRSLLTIIDTLPQHLRYIDFYDNSIRYVKKFPSTLEYLECYSNRFDSLFILPPNLIYLGCSSSGLRSLPALPSTLRHLGCASNPLTTLPTLPSTIEILIANFTSLTSLPPLPNSLKNLQFSYGNIPTLPTLPPNLIYLYATNSRIVNLPSFPNTLKTIYLSYNQIRTLPSLPDSLIELNITSNPNLSNIPTLPQKTTTLYISSDSLLALPTLPNSLITLECQNNKLVYIPTLPSKLKYFNCSNNIDITCLPHLNDSLRSFTYGGLSISCLPNYVNRCVYSPLFSTYNLCLPDSCVPYQGIMGNIHLELNSNCIKDGTEPYLNNINVRLKQGSTLIATSTTDLYGKYQFLDTIANNTYTISIDSSEIPFYYDCPNNGIDTVVIDATHRFIDSVNMSVKCKPVLDIGIIGIYTNRVDFNPGTYREIGIYAGNINEAIYNGHCFTTSISGSVILNYSGPITFIRSDSSALIPDTILPNHIVWNIADFSTIDIYNDFKLLFLIDSTALSGEILTFEASIPVITGDLIPSNNDRLLIFVVGTPYDPNFKDVNPSGSVTSSQEWLNYIIHFQNIGTIPAENIYLWDTIDPNLDLNTIQVLDASHNQFMTVFPTNRSVRFQYDDINLPDSTSDEPNSHGWVQYRIKLKPGLPEGTLLHNTAGIYFDLNAPIITNTTETKICNTTVEIDQTITIPFGGSAIVGSHTYTNAGVYTDLFMNINGCDSLVNTTIIEATCSPIASSSQSITINEGQSYTIGSNTYTVAGTYIDTIPTTDGNCDSLAITTNLTVINGIENLGNINLAIYPNPTKNLVTIDLIGIAKAPIQIFDMYGNLIYSNTEIKNKIIIDTENWSNGTYIIQYNHQHVKLMVSH